MLLQSPKKVNIATFASTKAAAKTSTVVSKKLESYNTLLLRLLTISMTREIKFDEILKHELSLVLAYQDGAITSTPKASLLKE